MKILFFIESLRAGGKERRILELLKGLKRYDDIQLEIVLTRKEIHYEEFFDLNIPLHVIERNYLKKDPLLFLKFYRVARKIKPDIIHVWGNMVAVYAVPTVWHLGIPMLNNQITDATPNLKPLGKNITFRMSAKVIANTEAGLKAYNAPPEKSGVIYNGFNFQRLDALRDNNEVRREFNISTKHVIGMVATLSPYKDYATYIRAAQRILERRTDVTFLCIGEGDASSLRQMVAEKNKSKILFLGKQKRVESIMNICDVGVLVTDIRNHAEGISNALLEFMALGKPVIATNYGGSVELVQDANTGYLIDAFSDQQLADRIDGLLSDEVLRNRMGSNSLARIHSTFSIDRMITAFYEEYHAILKPGAEPR
jgi:glycosyltransferase involved in cell wall biosynthesis